jgi:hypothetical protein
VSARLLAEQLWHQPGDEAFTAGLLQDIGILVLLHELGEPYAKFLTGVMEEKCHLAALEQDILHFDHIQLSAALLRRWQLPQRLVEAIELPKRQARLARMSSPEADLPQILHLADMLTQLVGHRRLHVLQELLEAGKQYRGMTRSKLAALVEGLQPQVDQLGEALSLELSEKRDYVRMLLDAHRRMAALSEQMAREPSVHGGDDRAYAQLLSHTTELSGAMRNFLGSTNVHASKHEAERRAQHAGHAPGPSPRSASLVSSFRDVKSDTELALQLVAAATRCRDRRQELSLVMAEPNVYDIHTDPDAEAAVRQTRCALEYACAGLGQNKVTLVSLPERRTAAIISNCERRAALAMAKNAIAELAKLVGPESEPESGVATTFSIGVATASVVPKNFDALAMIDSAARCMSAARACGISAVKSIEV